jgi:hypothetical protein
MVVRATRDIAAGEDITHTYVDPLEPIQVRDGKKYIFILFMQSCRKNLVLVIPVLFFYLYN